MHNLAVLISGNGSNLQAILDAVDNGDLPDARVALVVSNRKDAYGMQRAFKHGVPVVYFPKLPYTNANRPRADYDADLARIVQGFGVEWVVQAGWMHIFTDAFIRHFPNRIVNLHPALPGMFPGAHAIEEAYAAYQRGEIDHTGVMVHLVPDEAVDAGPVVAQMEIPILPEDSLEDLEKRIHAAEHTLLISALRNLITH
ncbi:MAG TPA: phosphoribosylglycinamide formyltransferase [Anaerolineae bacterium]|nr:phosphoribosylglycinamide formyltransferase [Anaerolineae bacterium]